MEDRQKLLDRIIKGIINENGYFNVYDFLDNPELGEFSSDDIKYIWDIIDHKDD